MQTGHQARNPAVRRKCHERHGGGIRKSHPSMRCTARSRICSNQLYARWKSTALMVSASALQAAMTGACAWRSTGIPKNSARQGAL